ncbi:MAG: glutathione S-transferase family protein [Rhizobiaceae bacterium]
MPKILVSTTSPYSSKVRMAATYAGYDFDSVITDTTKQSPELFAQNPLGKIPVLLTENDGAVFDSVVIVRYINRATGGKLLPRAAAKLLEAERLEAIADGICDCAIAHIYEQKQRPEELIYQGWLDKQWKKVTQGLDYLEGQSPKLPAKIHAGHMALAACLGYMALRFPGWEKGRPKLKRYLAKYKDKHPALAALLPHLPA